MKPSSSIRRRGQDQSSSSQDSSTEADDTAAKVVGLRSTAIAIFGGLVVAVTGWFFLASGGGSRETKQEEVVQRDPELLQLLAKADESIRKEYNYPKAHEYLSKALQMSPSDVQVRWPYATVQLALGKLEEAWTHLDDIFRARGELSKDTHFLQQYVLSMHRLEKTAELETVWPKIVATPGVKWRTPFQCPDQVDETLLDGAVPFPLPSSLKVPSKVEKHRAKILAEFDEFKRSHSDWDSKKYFAPNQDNDLVDGNEETRWTEMLLFHKGLWDYQNCRIMKTACKVLKNLLEVEGIVHGKRSGQVSLLKLKPGTKLVPHFGGVNWRYVMQFGLQVPEGVTIYAGNESRVFERGTAIVLDDSFLHSVTHDGDDQRVTLFANFFRPDTKPISYDEYLASKYE
eukprot:TRINITY_DN111800_c0_g1_i1.p1 TRINITY_DN111800_c0_g1~~TRINITY_DN111800_c0_g1_i1.p1  ORF type:complete len:400 (+),score=99.28 TRINITY_DN111800_c0_g1_i1:138-1337(+)